MMRRSCSEKVLTNGQTMFRRLVRSLTTSGRYDTESVKRSERVRCLELLLPLHPYSSADRLHS
jgi:hypothetical protein